MNITDVFNLSDALSAEDIWKDRVSCSRVNARQIMEVTDFDGLDLYAFILVRKGQVTLSYKRQIITLCRNDIFTYAPGQPTVVMEASDDYDGYCLMLDAALPHETPAMHHIIRAAYFPMAELGKPKLTLSEVQARDIADLFRMLRRHILHETPLQQEAVYAACNLFSIHLLNAHDMVVLDHRFTTRAEEVFTAFLRLVPLYYKEHRDLAFYADRLNITTTYLSRIVRQLSGRTVTSFIDHAIASEATLLLKTTNLTITQLADEFHFSTQAAFTKFFTRMKGISPKEFRKGKQ